MAVPLIPAYTGACTGHKKNVTVAVLGGTLAVLSGMLTLVAGVLIVVAARLEVAFVVVRG